MKRMIEAQLKPVGEVTEDVIELEAAGLATGLDRARPVLLFREKGGESILPVWLSPLDAGIAVTQNHVQAFALSPHDVSLHAMKALGIRLESCHFIELKGNQQYIELKFAGSRRLKTLRVRADHAISFCLHAQARFFCSRKFLAECREVDAHIERLEVSLNHKPSVRKNTHPYLN
ncbi:MAG: bifunctional nuclease domain-containing protein [Bdellovibrionales bacterium]